MGKKLSLLTMTSEIKGSAAPYFEQGNILQKKKPKQLMTENILFVNLWNYSTLLCNRVKNS